ncbi:MAG TPA: heterodisulfide reductase-related iron-sulfur binding cluster [Dehalococcoidia bacterium]|nr:heterodisulfide reductase-related iron-sulfur binding cluster [Dehalococcoidia bacterium]
MLSTPRSDILSRFAGKEGPEIDELSLCVHCGFCLNACPTYLDLGLETDSPRGRVYLMRALHEGRVNWTPRVQQHFDQCLQCRACETACPSGVPYGRLMEATRTEMFTQDRWGKRQRLAWNLVMRRILPYPKRLELAFLGLRAYQKSGLQRLVRATGILARISPRLAETEALAPDATHPFFIPTDVRRYAPRGEQRGQVVMLTGCIMPLSFPATHHATARVLSRNGFDVLATPGQRCCGALHAHGGDIETARDLARHDIDAFLAQEPDAIIVNSAGCGAHMKEYGHLLRSDPAYAEKAAHFSTLVRDIHEFLVGAGFDAPQGSLDRSITYQDSCHLVHAQKVTTAPREILSAIPGLELVEMAHPDRCCGSAGLYSIAQKKISRSLLRDKMVDVNATGADQVCTANPGCMVQLDAGIRLFSDPDGPSGATAHAIDLLDESYHLAEGDGYADR